MNGKQARALRKLVQYKPRKPVRGYVKIKSGTRSRRKFILSEGGDVSSEDTTMEMFTILYKDELRLQYHSLKKAFKAYNETVEVSDKQISLLEEIIEAEKADNLKAKQLEEKENMERFASSKTEDK